MTKRHYQEIGPIPLVVDPRRRQRAENDLRFFLETYFPKTFTQPFNNFHLKLIRHLENSIKDDHPRMLWPRARKHGEGVTSICLMSLLWGGVCGHRRVLEFQGDTHFTCDLLKLIAMELTDNDRLFRAFPEVCFPFWRWNGCHQSRFQRIQGEPTNLLITREKIILPTVRGSKASGVIIQVRKRRSRQEFDDRFDDFVLVDHAVTDTWD